MPPFASARIAQRQHQGLVARRRPVCRRRRHPPEWKLELAGLDRFVNRDIVQRHQRVCSQVVEEHHAIECSSLKPSSTRRNRYPCSWAQLHPGRAGLVIAAVIIELLQRIFGTAQQQRRRIRQCFGLRLDRDLGEIDVVAPDVQTVRDQPLARTARYTTSETGPAAESPAYRWCVRRPRRPRRAATVRSGPARS